jgi:hypothetical protein
VSHQPLLVDFIRSTFPSVWALELMCYLRRRRDESVAREDLVAALRASDLVVEQGARSLLAAGLVVVEGEQELRYRAVSEDLDALAGEAAALYARSPNAVRRLIVAGAASSAVAFADAFRLRKD